MQMPDRVVVLHVPAARRGRRVRRPPARRLWRSSFVCMLVALGGVVVRLAHAAGARVGHVCGARRAATAAHRANCRPIAGKIARPDRLPARDDARCARRVREPRARDRPRGEAAPLASRPRARRHRRRGDARGSDGTFVYIAPAGGSRRRRAASRRCNFPGSGCCPVAEALLPGGLARRRRCSGSSASTARGITGLERQYDGCSPARRASGRSSSPARVRRSAAANSVVREPRRGSDLVTDDRPRDPVPGAARTCGRRSGEPREGRHGDRDGPAHRRHLRDGDLPVLRPERLRRGSIRPPAEPRGHRHVGAGLGEQDRSPRPRRWRTARSSPTERFAVPATREVDGYTIHDAEAHPTER